MMNSVIEFIGDLSLWECCLIGLAGVSLWVGWELAASYLHRRHQAAMAAQYQRRTKFFAWMENVRKEMASRGCATIPLPALDFDCDWHHRQESEGFRWELFFDNGRSPQHAFDAWEAERRELGTRKVGTQL